MPVSSAATLPRARWSLMALFALFGVTGTSWMSRLPSIRAHLDVSTAQLGGLLVVGAVGALVAVVVTGAVVARLGSRTTLVAATVGTLAGFGLLAAGTSASHVGLFAAGVGLVGVSGALTNVPINLNAAVVEHHVGRAVLPHFHAAFSIGAAAGALVAAGFAWAGVGISVQLVVMALVVATARGLLIPPATALAPERVGRERGTGEPVDPGHAAAAPGRATAEPRRRGAGVRAALAAWREPRTLLVGLVLLASSLSEGSAGNWLSIAVVDGFAVREAIGAAAYGTFVGAMTVVRFAGTGLIDRFGRVAVLRASGVSALAGLLLFGLAPSLPTAWVGVVLWGCGAALANPIAVAAASDEPAHAAARVAVVTSFSSVAQLSAPPLLGLLAESVGTRHALLTLCAAMVLSLVVANAVRPVHRQHRQHRQH